MPPIRGGRHDDGSAGPSGAAADEQQIKYSQGIWVHPPFCDSDLNAAPLESTTVLKNGTVEVTN
jgi:hypothetical protein